MLTKFRKVRIAMGIEKQKRKSEVDIFDDGKNRKTKKPIKKPTPTKLYGEQPNKTMKTVMRKNDIF